MMNNPNDIHGIYTRNKEERREKNYNFLGKYFEN